MTATGVMGLFMAVIGLYGVVAYAVSRRTREIGIRLVIGATPASVMRMVLKQGAGFTTVGLAIGLALAIPIARNFVPNIAVEINPLGGIVLLGVPALLAATMAACWIPGIVLATATLITLPHAHVAMHILSRTALEVKGVSVASNAAFNQQSTKV